MAYELIWAPAARLDLKNLAAYIAEDNPAAAQRFVRGVFQILGVCRRNAKPSDSPDDFSHFGDDFRGFTDLRKRKSLEFRAAYPTF